MPVSSPKQIKTYSRVIDLAPTRAITLAILAICLLGIGILIKGSNQPVTPYPITPEQVTWQSWLSGNSLSAQFHFIDLLELLERQKSDKNNQDLDISRDAVEPSY